MWKKQRKLIINCVRTTADKCELMHKTQAELILNISVTGGSCGFNHTVSSWRASVVEGGAGGTNKEREKRKGKKFPPDWSSHGLPCRRVSRFQQ